MGRLNVLDAAARRRVSEAVVHEAGAKQGFAPEVELKRLMQTCLLGEKSFYLEGAEIEARLRELVKAVHPQLAVREAFLARTSTGLRHAPLVVFDELARLRAPGKVEASLLRVLRTPKDALDLVALYWRDGKKPLPAAWKRAIRQKFQEWTPYQLEKYGTLRNVKVRLRDLLFLTHPKPVALWKHGLRVAEEEDLAKAEGRAVRPVEPEVDPIYAATFKALADDTVKAPDTWESRLSEPGADKRVVWEDMLAGETLGEVALIRNLRNMTAVGVDPDLIVAAVERASGALLWPHQVYLAAEYAPPLAVPALERLALRSCGELPKLPGRTAILVDVSGSMVAPVSDHGTTSRARVAAVLASVLAEVCERSLLVGFHTAVEQLPDPEARGVELARALASLPSGGTDVPKAVYWALGQSEVDRVVVLTDEQSQFALTGRPRLPVAIVNLAPTMRGLTTEGAVVRINGWSGGVVRYLIETLGGDRIIPSIKMRDGEED
jgi:hypothetical protein